MKKFFLTIVFIFIATFAMVAQTLNLNGFTAVPTAGVCNSDGKILVTLPNTMGPSGKTLRVRLAVPGEPTERVQDLQIGTTNNKYEFTLLKAGNYTVTVQDLVTANVGTKLVQVTSSYVAPDFVGNRLNIKGPSCVGSGDDGGLSFQIVAGAKGPFKVKFTKGSTVIYDQTLTKTAGAVLNVNIQGTTAKPIRDGYGYQLTIEDLAGGVANCGEIKTMDITIPGATENVACMEFEKVEENSILQKNTDCKFRLSLQIRRKGSLPIAQLENAIKTSPAKTAVVRRWDKAGNFIGEYDITTTYQNNPVAGGLNKGYSYYTPWIFEEDDTVEFEIKLGKTPIKEKFKLSKGIVNLNDNKVNKLISPDYFFLNVDGIVALEVLDRSNLDPSGNCTRTANTKYLYVDTYKRKIEFNNEYGGKVHFGEYHWESVNNWIKDPTVPGAGYYYEVYKWTGVGDPGWDPNYTSSRMNDPAWVKLNIGSDYTWINKNYADLTNQPEGYYKVRFVSRNAAGVVSCYQPERMRYIKPVAAGIKDPFNGLEINNGAFKGTVSIRKWLGNYMYNYPITVTVDYLDDGKSGTTRPYSFQTSLPFEKTRTETITFPLVREVDNPDVSTIKRFEFGDLPAGEYRITIKDKCGNTATDDFNLDTPMQYTTEKFEVKPGCGVNGSLSYEIAAPRAGTVKNLQMRLLRKNPATGDYDNVSPGYFRLRSGIFSNLQPGDYVFETQAFYYARVKMWRIDDNKENLPYPQNMHWETLDPSTSNNGYTYIRPNDAYTSDPEGNGTIAYHTSKAYFTIRPAGNLDVDVVGTSCSAAAGSGIVAVNIKNPEYIQYPLQFKLLNLATGVEVASSPEYGAGGATSTATGYVFKNVADGNYTVIVKHSCGELPYQKSVLANNYSEPGVRYAFVSPPCGREVKLTFDGSEQLFNIEWFRVETGGSLTSIGTGQSVTDTVDRATTYVVTHSLKDATLCTSGSGTKSVTVTFASDTQPPVITGCPTAPIVDNALTGQCYGKPTWGVVTATDNCGVVTYTQSHKSGERMDIGTHTVVYTFTDAAGNTSTCSFTVTVKSRAINMVVKNDYVDGTGNVINRDLALNENFYYRITYQNQGTEAVTSSTLEVTLPTHANVTIDDSRIDVSGASWLHYKPTFTRTGNTFKFEIPYQTLTAGSNLRTILIPISLKATCADIGKPCMNLLQSSYTMTYEGGNGACKMQDSSTASKTIAISTSSCDRTELACPGETIRLSAIDGFAQYKWYKNNVLQTGAPNSRFFDATDPADYKVEKITTCNGVSYTTTEHIKLQNPADVADPIKPQANGGDVCPGDGTWVSHFILCNQPSRNIVVNFTDSNIEWQKLKSGASPSSLNCPNKDDSAWVKEHSNNTYVANTQGHYRLKVTSKTGGCDKYFYFDVFTNSLSGAIVDFGNVTSYQQGFISIRMATAGIQYKYVLKNSAGNVVPQNGQQFVIDDHEYRVPITAPDTYTVEVTSPSLPDSCKVTLIQKIEKNTTLTARAIPKAWKDCNKRTIRFEADGGKNPYEFIIWSVDGVARYSDYTSAPFNSGTVVATIPAGASFVEADVTITQPGKYVFLAKDANTAFAVTPEVDIYPEGFLGYTINKRDILCGSAPNSGQISVTYNTQQNVKSTLYKLDNTGARVQTVGSNSTGYFNNLTEGRYELEIKVQLSSSNTCTYTNPNIYINSIESTLKASAGVAEDISCDTQTPTQYIVHVNNVRGGTGSGYEFSTDNVNYQPSPILRVGSSATSVFVRDSNKCTIEIPISIKPIVPATATITAVQYDCDGKGTFTVTANPAGTYEYQVIKDDGTLSETRTSNVFTLSPGIYSIYIHYTPTTATGTTPNILFNEDFGTGTNTCDSSAVLITCAGNSATLGDNQYMITQQVPSSPNWVSPTPTDASGMANGRYLAINGSSPDNDNGVVYRHIVRDVVVGQELSVSVQLFNLLPSSFIGGTNPNLVVRIYNPGNLTQYVEKSLGEISRSGAWQQKKVTFAGVDVTLSAVLFEIRNIAPASAIGSDLAVDDIQLSQPTKVCKVRAEGVSVKIDNDRAFKVTGTASDEKCGGDGQLRLVVDNPPASLAVEYQLAGTTTWTGITLTAVTPRQGVATITGLPAVANGTIFVRKANDHSCKAEVNYTIKKPDPLTVTATITAPVTCSNPLGTAHFTAMGGARPYTQFSFQPIGGGTPGASNPAVNNEADFNIGAGTYQIEVKDANGCTATATFVVPQPKTLSITVEDLEPCYKGGNSARIQVKVISGNGGYQFSKDGGATFETGTSSTSTFIIYENLTANTYNFVVKDAYGCDASTSYTVDNPFRMQAVQVDPLTCAPNSEATFSVTYSGGKAGTREFLWSNSPTTGFTTSIPTGMSLTQSGNVFSFKTRVEGDYYFKVRYQMDNGDYCEETSNKFEVKVSRPTFTVTPTVENVSCAGGATSKVLINPSSIRGGIPPYTMLFYNGITTTTLSVGDIAGLAVGTYTITLRDSGQCQSAPIGFTITQTAAMVVTATHQGLTCSAAGTQLGSAQVTIQSGGTAPYKVILKKNGVDAETRTAIPAGALQQFNSLDIATYQIVVEDAKGCTYHYDFTVAGEANKIDTRPSANIGCSAATGEIAVSGYNITGSHLSTDAYYFAVYREGMGQLINPTLPTETVPNADGTNDTWYRGGAVVTTTLSGGGQVQASTHTFTGLVPGVKYTFVVFHTSSQCMYRQEASIPVPTQSPLKVNVVGTASTTCINNNDGKVIVHLSDWPTPTPVKYDVYVYPPSNPLVAATPAVTGTLNPTAAPTIGQDFTITGIPAGRYFVLFTDKNGTGCTKGSDDFIIGKSTSSVTVSATVVKQANCKQPASDGLGRIVVDVQGGQAPYKYYYHNMATPVPTGVALDNALTNSTDGVSKDVISGTWMVFVRDSSGCMQQTVTQTVALDPQPSIASATADDACSDRADYPIKLTMTTIGVGQHQYRIDGVTNWQNLDVSVGEFLLPVRLGPQTPPYTIYLRDANGCETSTTVNVYKLMDFDASHDPLIPCGATNTVTIHVNNITGGSGAYKIGISKVVDKGLPTEREIVQVTPGTNVAGTTHNAIVSGGAGNYRISIYDATTFGTSAECARIKDFVVRTPDMPTLELMSVSTPTCYQGTSTIRVKANPASAAPYDFTITPITPGMPMAGVTKAINGNYVIFNNVPTKAASLGGAQYLIKAMTAQSCTTTMSVTVESPEQLVLTPNALTATDYKCEADGSTSNPTLKFDLSALSGGSTPYTRVEFKQGTTVLNQQNFTTGVTEYTYTLPSYVTVATPYHVEVYDANGCSVTSTAVTVSPTLIMSDLTAVQTQALTCAQNETLVVTVSTTTVYNNEPIEYSIAKVGEFAPIQSATLNSLTWTLTLTDPSGYVIKAKNTLTGCEITTSYDVLNPNTLLLEAKDPVRVQCFGGTGSITLELTDTRLSDGDQVANGFNYTIYTLPTGPQYTSTSTGGSIPHGGLPAGKYRVEAEALLSHCKAETTFELVQAEKPIEVFAQETFSVTCDNNRGEIFVRVTGGWAPYKVDIQGGGITGQQIINQDGDGALFTGLMSTGFSGGIQTYTITVTDAWGCSNVSGTTQVGLKYPDTITATVSVTQQPTCKGSSDGIIEVTNVSGGSGRYYYTLVDSNLNASTQTDTRFTDLLPGMYSLEIMDTWGCTFRKDQIEIKEPEAITVSITNSMLLVCHKDKDAWVDYEIKGGRPPYDVQIVHKGTNVALYTKTGVASGTTERVPGLAAGEYEFIVKDSSRGGGCTMSPTYEFVVQSAPDLEATTEQGYNCDNNEFSTWIEVRFKDPVDFNKITYKLNGGPAQTFSRNNGISAGYIDQNRFDRSIATQTLEIIYSDVHSVTGATKVCNHTLTKPVTVEEIYQLSNIVKSPTTQINTLVVEGVGGKKPYYYTFNGDDHDTNNVYELKKTDPDFTDPVNGKKYKLIDVLVRDTAGCTITKTFKEEYFDIFIPNYFTPNGDGTFDTWTPRNVEKFPFIKTYIYDRYGRRIKTLSQGEAWDGNYEGKPMPTGDYWYIIELNDEFDDRTFNGHFTLYR